jgi:hypothetical protein
MIQLERWTGLEFEPPQVHHEHTGRCGHIIKGKVTLLLCVFDGPEHLGSTDVGR